MCGGKVAGLTDEEKAIGRGGIVLWRRSQRGRVGGRAVGLVDATRAKWCCNKSEMARNVDMVDS